MKQYQAIFFDLDGTLLPMDFDTFVNTYFGLLAARFPQYEAKALIAAVYKGTMAMTCNDGTMTNEQRFWSVFSGIMGQEVLSMLDEFEDFYHTDFHKVKQVCGENPLAPALVAKVRERAGLVVLATNPLFPRCGVASRLSWIGLKPEDFDYITTYENSSWCKPSPEYYRNICSSLDVDPARCLMIGNDLREDAQAAQALGMHTHIITDSLITHGLNLEDWPHSSFQTLLETL